MHTDPQHIASLAQSTAALALSEAARMRLSWIVYFALHGGSVLQTCSQFGISRSTLNRWLDRFDPNDLTSLEERAHDSVTLRTPVIPESTISLIRTYRIEHPRMGKEKIAAALQSDHNIVISSSSVGRVIEREKLYFGANPLHWRKRIESHVSSPFEAPLRHGEVLFASAKSLEPRAGHLRVTYGGAQEPCTCTWCVYGPRIKRTVIIGSVLTNIAVAILFIATAFWESKNTGSLSASVTTVRVTNASLDENK